MTTTQATWDLKVSSKGGWPVAVQARRHRFLAGVPVQFDDKYEHVTALEYVLGGVAADLVGTLQYLAVRQRVPLSSVEAVVSGSLRNPAQYVDMVGDADEAGMERFVMTVYVQSTAADTALQNLWRRALEVSPMARTLAEAVQLELSLKIF